ncbi:hypothetical protein EMA8858_00272 [Emticicia aquatica]|jgi:hypothetical protein|uniref:Uncharacterized protein n=1 Tax=Emticicia aquatica TaxID=1681835 RepID=A0ABN8EMS3_9BACT|nr:hypothetical protein [Emticicia aquatica]CAH0994165.1 hypothetical protein EMA8858_00272 [Emticicia aquatica]
MNLNNEILREYSRTNVENITNYIGADKERFAELMQIFLDGGYVKTQRSSWIVSECAKKNPSLITPYFKNFIDKLHEPNIHDSSRRNIVRIWQFVEIPEQFIGEIYDICFRYLASNEAIAVIAFSITVCYNISKKIPELKPELRLMIEDLLLKHQSGSPAIKSRAKKVLADLKKK